MFHFDANTVLQLGSKIIVLFLCIPIHEYAHAWAATKQGDPTPQYQGRLSLNPFAHLDILGSIMIVLVGFGWGKPVNVNPNNFKSYRKGMAVTAAAGPISNVILAFIAVILYKIFYHLAGSAVIFWLAQIMYFIAVINLGLAVFNLLPIAPLDGQKILSYFTPPKFNRFMETYENYIYIGLILLVITGVLDKPLALLQNGIFFILDKLTFWVDPILTAILR